MIAKKQIFLNLKLKVLIKNITGISMLCFLPFLFYGDVNKLKMSYNNNKTTIETPNDWMAQQRCYPYNKIKLKSYLLGMSQAQEIHKRTKGIKFSWQPGGPNNIGGRITDIAVHPNDLSTIYIGAASGGIFKTTDGGISWINIFTDATAISIGDLAIDPTDQNIIYAGTGEANASSYSFFGNGIYKSTDAGTSWVHVGLDSSAYIGRIIVDSANPNRVFVAACGTLFSPNQQRGIYRSDDGGQSWTRKLFVNDSTSAIDIVQDPCNPNILFAAMWERVRGLNYRRSFGDGSGIYYSSDYGDNWVELTSGLPSGPGVGRIGLTICRSNPQVLYAFYDNQSGIEVYKTINGGNNWTRVNDGPLQGMNSNFGWYFGQIRVDPSNENRVFVLGVTLYRSDNGGSTWSSAYYGLHVDHHAMFIDENSGLIYEGNDGGFYYSDNYGNSWTKINNLPITQFYAIDIDNTFPDRIYGGTQDNGTIRTLTGAINNWQSILGGDGMYCLVDHKNPDRIFAEAQWGALYRSTNGGNYFNWIAGQFYSDRKNWMAPYAMHPINPDTLYFGTYRIWKTLDGGDQWTAVSGDLTKGDDGSTFHTVTTIDISPVDSDIVIAGTDDGRVHVSTDAGASWMAAYNGLPDRWITRVAADPFVDSTIYVTVSGFRWDEPLSHVYKSIDLGQNWIDVSSGLPEIPMNCIALDPLMQNRIFVGSDAGVFFSDNGGQGWISLSQGIPNVAVTSLKIHNNTRKIVAGTYGCSTYILDLDSLVSNLCLTGIVKYNNSASTPLSDIKLFISDSMNNVVDSTRTNHNGYYSFYNITPGSYNINPKSNKQWGGGNSTDALLTMQHFVGLDTLNGLSLQAADTDGTGFINSSDALMIQKRFIALIDSFPVGDWVFEKPSVNISTGSFASQDIYGMCYGDIDGSYIQPATKESRIKLEKNGMIVQNKNDLISIPVLCGNNSVTLGAMSLVIDYDNKLIDITGVESKALSNSFLYNILEDEVRISWYDCYSNEVCYGDTLFVLVLNEYPGTIFCTAFGEAVDNRGISKDLTLLYPDIRDGSFEESNYLSVFPNPFKYTTNVFLRIPSDDFVSLRIIDINGKFVFVLHDGFLSKGEHTFIWNGNDQDGLKVNSGIYFISLEERKNSVLKIIRL